MIRPLDSFFRDKHGVYSLPCSQPAFSYSDGQATEHIILNVLTKTGDLSVFSEDLIKRISDWATEYHFCSERHNLLRHVQLHSGMRILELGAGCGAITRQLGETGAEVVAVEGSYQRACAAAARCRGLENVKVYCSNFQKIKFSATYDFVSLVGVLEYAPQYFASASPVKECLKLATAALKPDGVLVIAIENQLGLKYFCGLREDHVDISYFGIEDRYNTRTAITFGRRDLNKIVQEVGLSFVEFNYPFPDYKIPRVVFTERAFTSEIFRPDEIIRQLTSRDYSGDLGASFNERLAIPVLCRNGMMQDLSNSFLVFASRDMCSIEKLYDHELLATAYATERLTEYNVCTRFLQYENEVAVTKDKMCQRQLRVSHGNVLEHLVPLREMYVSGLNLDAEYRKYVALNDFESFHALLDKQIGYLVSEAVLASEDIASTASMVHEDFFDCTPANLILLDGDLHYVDREWRLLRPMTLASLLLKTVDALHNIDKAAPELSRETLFAFMAQRGLAITPQMIDEYNTLIKDVLAQVYPKASTEA